MIKAKKTAYLAVSSALAIVLSYVESQIPVIAAVPGIKAGLANIAVVFVLYRFGFREAVCVSFVRILLVSVMFGSVVSLAYSLSGAVLSLVAMLIAKRLGLFSVSGVSVCGAVMHNAGQILAASLLIKTDVLKYYLPFLIAGGLVSGVIIGLISSFLIKRIKLEEF